MSDKPKTDIKRLQKVKEDIASKRPDFVRSEAYRFPRLGDKWRSSKGIRSKMRLKKKSRAAIVETGYRGPALTRGLNPAGMREVLVYRVADLEETDPSEEVIRIAAAVGMRKRAEILAEAEKRGLYVVNPRRKATASAKAGEEGKGKEEEKEEEEGKEEEGEGEGEGEGEKEAEGKENEASAKPEPEPEPEPGSKSTGSVEAGGEGAEADTEVEKK